MPDRETATETDRRRPTRALSAALCLLIGLLVWMNIVPQVGRAYTTDSYAYILLGRSLVEHGTFATSAIRDFYGTHSVPQLSRSFPPVYPALVGLMDAVGGLGIASGPLVNALAIIGSIALAWWLSKVTTVRRGFWMAIAVAIFMITNSAYMSEVASGRAYPLTLALYLASLVAAMLTLKRREWLVPGAAAMAVSLGLMVLVRFDQLLVAGMLALVVMIAWIMIYGFAHSRRAMVVLASVGLLVYAPWGVRNVRVYGTPFASDNSMTAISTHGGGNLASRYYAPGKAPETVREQPRLWLQQRAGYLLRNSAGALQQAIFWLIPLLLLLPFVVRNFDTSQKVFAALLVGHAAVIIFTVSTTPYRDPRYLMPVSFDAALLLALCAAVSASRFPRLAQMRLQQSLAGAVVLFLIVGAFQRRAPDHTFVVVPGPTLGAENFESMHDRLQHVIAPGDLVAVPDAEHLTYATGIAGIHLPRNVKMNDAHFRAWLAAWQPQWVLAPNDWIVSMQLQDWNTPAFTDSAWKLLRVPDSLKHSGTQ